MKRIIGILTLVLVLYGLILASDSNARTLGNHQNLALRLGKFGVLTLGAGILIIAGGIDLSIGSVVGLSSIVLGLLLNAHVHPVPAVAAVLCGAVFIGMGHGLLVTRLKLQPFIVTLCGLFIYRGMAYWLSLEDPMAPVQGLLRFLSLGHLFTDAQQTGSARNVGIGAVAPEVSGLVFLSTGYPEISFLAAVPVRLWLLLGLALLAGVFMHVSVYGRYLYAIGANEQAARYAGVPTDRYKILAYILCAMTASIAGMLEMLEIKTATPSSSGQSYELYAITGAVLGGCSLRGGEGTIVGIILGAAVLPLLNNLIIFAGIKSDLEYMVIGFALLLGTIADEVLKRRAAQRA